MSTTSTEKGEGEGPQEALPMTRTVSAMEASSEDFVDALLEVSTWDLENSWIMVAHLILGHIHYAEALVARGHPDADAAVGAARAIMFEGMQDLTARLHRLFAADPAPSTTLDLDPGVAGHTALEALIDRAVRKGIRGGLPSIQATVRAGLDEHAGVPAARDAEVLTTQEAAALSRVSPGTIRRWVKSGRLSPLGNRPYKFARSAVVAARDRKPEADNVFDLDLEREVDAMLDKRRRR